MKWKALFGVAVIVAVFLVWRSCSHDDAAPADRGSAAEHPPPAVTQKVTLADGGVIVVAETKCEGWLHGVITDLVGGGPIDHAEITAGKISTQSADDGSYSLCLTPGYQAVRVIGEGFAYRGAEVLVGRDTTKDFALSAEAVVTGTVIYQVTKKPAPNIDIVVSTNRGDVHGTSDVNGAFEVHHVPSDHFHVHSETEGYFTRGGPWGFANIGETVALPRPLELVAVTDSQELVILTHPATITGHTLRNGKPIGGVTVTTRRARTVSAEDGSYHLTNLEPGEYALYAELQGVAFTRNRKVTVKADDKITYDLDLDLAGTIHGVVVDQNDRPVYGANVSFSLSGDQDYGNAMTHDDGSFSATAMAGGGSYFVQVRDREHHVLDPAAGGRWPRITLPDGKSDIDAGKLRVHVETLAISGRVVDESGAPAIDVSVYAAGDRDSSSTTTDRNGAFSIEHLHPGTYALSAVSAGGSEPMKVAAGTSGVVLRATKPGALTVTIEGASSLRVTIDGPYFRDHVVVDHDYTFEHLTIGTYEVELGDPAMQQSVEVSSGQTAHVTFRPKDVGSIVVHVTMNNEPVEGRCGVVNDVQTGATIRFDNVIAGPAFVMCQDMPNETFKSASVDVITHQTSEITIALEPRRKHDAGLTIEAQFDEVIVVSVAPDGPAARSNVRAGDFIVQFNGRPAYYYKVQYDLDYTATNTLTLERDGQTFTTTITGS
ncbi:MAG: carboxypeptidase regulatory-like domain-containing protein [Kofleriaceae bacterium]